MITFSELQAKEIICINTGAKIGFIVDLEINPETGKIIAFIIFGREGSNFFKKTEEMIIYWNQIQTIGEDVILIQNK